MKKLLTLIVSTAILLSMPICAYAADKQAEVSIPVLESISFKNAVINEEFSPSRFDYTISLDDNELTPTLDAYSLSGDANIFVTYSADEANHQNGIVATIEHDNGSLIYTFMYSNVSYEVNGNNILADVNCTLGEVYPAINDKQTEYKLYIPSDLTELSLSAVTQDINAICDMPAQISVNAGQEPVINLTVTASNGEKRLYTLQTKRLNKTSYEVKKELADPEVKSIVQGELFYQKPQFLTTIVSTIGGILVVLLLVVIAKRLTVKVNDDDEYEFFDLA